VRKLLYEYKKSLRDARKLKRTLESRTELNAHEDIRVVNEMIADLKFAIDWITSGRNPDNNRGIERTSVYLSDPNILDSLYVHPIYNVTSRKTTSLGQAIIDDALCNLTKREKDAFIMVKVEGLSYSYTAELMGIKKTTLQNHMERAEKKIEIRKNSSLFLIS
jgi:positive control factor